MMPTLRSRRDTLMGVPRRLLFRLVSALGLALALIVGGWASAHAEADLPSAGTVTSVGTGSAPIEHGADVGSAEMVVTMGSETLGVATCIVGVLCTFLVFTLVRSFTLRARQLALLSRPVRAPLALLSHKPDWSFAPSLVQLSISRT